MKKDDVKKLVNQLDLINLHKQLETALKFASARTSAENIPCLVSLHQQANDACNQADAQLNNDTHAYFNSVVHRILELLDDLRAAEHSIFVFIII